MPNEKPDNFIHVIVVTTADDLDDRFNRHEPLRVVFERALALVGGQSQPDQFVLEYNVRAADGPQPHARRSGRGARLGRRGRTGARAEPGRRLGDGGLA